jgi:rod shape-determining protein MreD
MMRVHAGIGVIVASFAVALMLTAMPLPDWATAWRPAWVLMVLIYWCMAVPDRIGVGVSWVLGLLVDVLKGTLLGQHAAIFAVVAFITVKTHRRLRVYPLIQQAAYVGLMLCLHALWTLWVRGIAGHSTQPSVYWLPVLTSVILWPWLFVILRDLRRKAQLR